MSVSGRPRDRLVSLALLFTIWCGLAGNLPAQSLTSGSLRGAVLSSEGGPVRGAAVTLESAQGGLVLLLETDRAGVFQVPLLEPGAYRVLVEQVGYQPIRRVGVMITAGQASSITVTLERKPPPILAVTEVEGDASHSGSALARLYTSWQLQGLDRWRAVTDVTRGGTSFLHPFDGREGLGVSSGGLPVASSRLIVDGVPEVLLRHPGLPAEPLSSEAFGRDASDQAQVINAGFDSEWRPATGALMAIQSRRGTNTLRFAPYASFSGSQFGVPTELNPGDSTTTSFQVGAVLSGAIVPDTAHFLIQGGYQSIEMPTAAPWTVDTARYSAAPVSIQSQIAAIGADSFGTDLSRFVAPAVRTWKGGGGLAKVDWRISPTQTMRARVSAADWTERAPRLGEEPATNAGASLEARDISGALTLTSTGAEYANELRAGFSANRRVWEAPDVPATLLAAEGVGFGGLGALPGLFDQRAIDVSDAVQLRSGVHQFKFGAQATFLRYEQNYRYGSAGIWRFGDLDAFGQASGFYYQAAGTSAPVNFSSTEVGVFLQDTWGIAPDIQLLLGMRFDAQILPKNRIGLDRNWSDLSGIPNDITPKDRRGFSPHAGFIWDVQNRGEWVVRGGGGLFAGRLDPSVFAEAMQYDGDVRIRRGQGTFASWPDAPSATAAPTVGAAITLFRSSYRAPRTLKGELGITRTFPNGLAFTVSGSYHHTDFLLRRVDLNRQDTPLATTDEGRAVYGALVLEGGLIAPKPKSNRRFDDIDMVYGLVPTGFSDYYEFTTLLERRRETGISIAAAYTYSKTKDNMLGLRSADPADQLSPFPGGLQGGDWAEAASDFDVPHRVAGTIEYRSGGRTPVTVGARYRYQSGFPYTPGFRPGVDVNGDGSGGNDPVYLGGGVSGLSSLLGAQGCSGASIGGFAERNGCREGSRQALDARLQVGFPFGGSGARVALTVEAFNLAASSTGLVDHAAVLVDPAATPFVPGTATITLPLIANPNFGTILSRRDDPRLVRIGLRIDY